MNAPVVLYKMLPSSAHLIRFSDINDSFWYDVYTNNPNGIAMRHQIERSVQEYIRERSILTERKYKLIQKAQRELDIDKEFLELVYKGKSDKRARILNKFGGSLSMAHYSAQSEKFFHKFQPGAKKKVLNMAFQVGTFADGNYDESFIRILKTILMCQALNISVNIDMFDSDTRAINNEPGYVIVNVAKSCEKLDFRKILAASHSHFFNFTLFNAYSASGKQKYIGTFLGQSRIVKDLGEMYDIIGGNMLQEEGADPLVSKILKIGIHGR